MTSENDNSKKNIECNFCGRVVKNSYIKQHYKTKICLKARADAIPFESNKPKIGRINSSLSIRSLIQVN